MHGVAATQVLKMDSTKKHDKPSPYLTANLFSKLFFWWLKDLLLLGYRKDLDVEDLFNTLPEDDSVILGDRLERQWTKERAKESPNLKLAVMRTFWADAVDFSVIYILYTCVFRVGQAMFLCFLINSFGQEATDLSTKISLAVGLLLCSSGCVISFAHFMSRTCQCGMRIRVSLCSLIYRKVLLQSRTKTEDSSSIQVMNLLANDVTRFDDAPEYLSGLLTPIQVIVVMACAWTLMGISAIIGVVALTLLTVPLQILFGHLSSVLRNKVAQKTDKRVQLMNEILAGIQLIKMYAWETPFFNMLQAVRKSEMQSVLHANYVRGIVMSSLLISDRIALILTLLPYILLGNDITAAKVYAVAEMYSALKLGLAYYFPMALTTIGECSVSLDRIQKFLLQQEMTGRQELMKPDQDKEECAVKLADVTTGWVPKMDALCNISLDIKPGTMCAVVGHTGAGKSSLLHTLLGELPIRAGSMCVSGTVSYCSQESWLFSATVRRNILFGQEYDEQRYNEVIRVCALTRDLRILPQGDGTLVGEKGAALSGGQRARINLARAVYKKADIYLLDNPLAAVDTQVARQLLTDCICGFLKDTTRLLVVHQPQYVKEADLIIALNKGCIEGVGSYQEIQKKTNAFSQNLSNTDDISSENKETFTPNILETTEKEMEKAVDERDEESETAELLARGRVDKKVYSRYLLAGSSVFRVVMMATVFAIGQGLVCATDCWTAYWTNQEDLRRNVMLPVTSLPAQLPSLLPPFQNISEEMFHTPLKNMSASEKMLHALKSPDTIDVKHVRDHSVPWNTTASSTNTTHPVLANSLVSISTNKLSKLSTETENLEYVNDSSSNSFSSQTFTKSKTASDKLTNPSNFSIDVTFPENETGDLIGKTYGTTESNMNGNGGIMKAITSTPPKKVTEKEIRQSIQHTGNVDNGTRTMTRREINRKGSGIQGMDKYLSESELNAIQEKLVHTKLSEASKENTQDNIPEEDTHKADYKNIEMSGSTPLDFPTITSQSVPINTTSAIELPVSETANNIELFKHLNVSSNVNTTDNSPVLSSTTKQLLVEKNNSFSIRVPPFPTDSEKSNDEALLFDSLKVFSNLTPAVNTTVPSKISELSLTTNITKSSMLNTTPNNITGLLFRDSKITSTVTGNIETSLTNELNSSNVGVRPDEMFPYFNATSKEFNLEEQMTTEMFLLIYALLVGITVISLVWRTNFYMQVLGRSSQGLHKKMLSSVLNSPMKFFDRNPSGRVMNRFTKDLGTVDEGMPLIILIALQNTTVAIGITIVVAAQNIWTLIPFGLASVCFWKMSQLYLATADDVRRLEGICRSPVYSHVSATIDGLATIRASGMSHLLRHEFDSLQNQHTAAWALTVSTRMFLNLWADLICTFFMTCIIVLFLLVADDMPSGAVGLTLSQLLALLGMISLGITFMTYVVNMMVFVERLVQYTELEPEPGLGQKPKAGWPILGRLEMENLEMSYSQDGPLVLKQLNIHIQPGEKIGIVGRTGAGKSSLAIALFRMAEWRGSIKVDGEDISQLALKELRQNISIIPQNTVLFSAPVRVNLDPTGTIPDIELWDALAQVELKGAIPSLDMALSEAGSNLSVGQRHLLCLARVILRRSKILVLDEATANVDSRTDALIQKSIRHQFQECTVISIAHRLNNIMETDRVLVLDEGQIMEFDHPHVLLQDSSGFLSKLLLNMDESTAESLRQMAAEAYKELQSKNTPRKLHGD